MGRVVFAVSLSVFLCVAATAQIRSVLPAPQDPFTLKKGSSFSASGGNGGVRPEPVAAAVSRISADITEAEELIRSNYVNARKVKTSDLTKGALSGALLSLDPHSSFFDPREWKDMLDEEQSGYSGIGATIASYTRGDETATYILATYPGSPAAKAQLKFGDKILAIDGESMAGRPTDEVRDRIRGSLGSVMAITVERASTLRSETITIRRGRVPQPSIPDAYLIREGVGYIELSGGFNYTTYDELDYSMKELKRRGMRSLVLDLRGNGGGIVDQAVKVAERFLPSGTLILTQKGRGRYDNRIWRSANAAPESMPLVVLVDENTASASEILTGALQDDDRAMIVGTRTFGKGLVQSVIDLPYKNGLTLTTARYLTPSGRSIQRDYTVIDTYDYFNHKSPAAAIDKPVYAARTVTDRVVYGGDGILPDEVVKGDRDSASQASLADPIFFFVREMVNGRMSAGVYRPAAYVSNEDEVINGLAATFAKFVRGDSSWVAIAPALLDSSYVTKQLNYNLTLALSGSIAAQHRLVNEDPQVSRAIELLPRAGQLNQRAETVRRTR